MSRLLLIVGVVAAIYLLYRYGIVRQKPTETETLQNDSNMPLVACAYCKVMVPKVDEVTRNRKSYCCIEHADLDSNK